MKHSYETPVLQELFCDAADVILASGGSGSGSGGSGSGGSGSGSGGLGYGGDYSASDKNWDILD